MGMTPVLHAPFALRRIAGAVAGALLAAVLAFSVLPAQAAFTAQQAQALKQINSYFDGIRRMQGEFIQFGPNGEQSEGVFFIERPGKIRFHYKPPVKMDVIADGNQVAIQDRSMMTQDLYPLSKTPLRYLLSDRIDLTSASIVREVLEEPDLITLVLVQESAFGDGTLRLIFDAKTYELKQWVVTDAQGLDTSVAIYNVETGKKADPDYFKIDYYRFRTGANK